MGGDAHDDEDTDLAAGVVDTTAGWEAIDRALRELHPRPPGHEPLHWPTILKWSLGGKDPLDGISAYASDRERPHWHLVSYGLSELYSKESNDPSTSGFGFELTLRLNRAADDEQPPAWALDLLRHLARHVFQTQQLLEPGQVLASAPLGPGSAPALRAVLFAVDPDLGAVETPNGRLEFVQVVGVTSDELAVIESWDGVRFAELLAARDPLLVTDLTRRSVLADPATAAAVAAAVDRDGSSMVSFATDLLGAAGDRRSLVLTVTAHAAGYLARSMRGRLLHDRPFTLRARQLEVLFEPAPVAAWNQDGAALVVDTTPALAHEIAATLAARPGVYGFATLPGFAIRVQP